ncbi:MAG: 2-oxoacid:acceptor oxidoreductase subunit alpha [Candidatus Coatesbacteria bacterium]|nr:2-oxoacid:acceptor oxidoreductase subunit alpha [Candidatus Coatesbacteria bacterium]
MHGEFFMNGDIACAEGGISGGCRLFAGYPITPATEIAERMSQRLPKIGGVFIQMEDEIASMNCILGASWGGVKSMTATSGPGFSLMMENLGLGVITETPCVLVDVQRGSPSTGLPTLVGQADMMQARWGSHGDYEIIAISPWSPQEAYDFTIKAFNLSEKYRTPVLVMTDEAVGHMTEKVTILPEDKIVLEPRRKPPLPPDKFKLYSYDEKNIPWAPNAGDGYRIHVTGLTHDERGYPVVNAETQNKLVRRLVNKIRLNEKEIADYKGFYMDDDPEIVIVSYGITARPSLSVVRRLRKKGMKIGLLKLNVVWPFPEDVIRKIASIATSMFTVENNLGQVSIEVERVNFGRCPCFQIGHAGGEIHSPEEIIKEIEVSLKNGHR